MRSTGIPVRLHWKRSNLLLKTVGEAPGLLCEGNEASTEPKPKQLIVLFQTLIIKTAVGEAVMMFIGCFRDLCSIRADCEFVLQVHMKEVMSAVWQQGLDVSYLREQVE